MVSVLNINSLTNDNGIQDADNFNYTEYTDTIVCLIKPEVMNLP